MLRYRMSKAYKPDSFFQFLEKVPTLPIWMILEHTYVRDLKALT